MVDDHAQHPNDASHGWQLAAVGGIAAVIAAPYLLPYLHIGDASLTASISSMCGNTSGGLTQAIEGALGHISPALSGVGWGASLTAGIIGIGGVMLGDYIHTHYDREGRIHWGKVIKYVALTTSILIALPSILSGISMGITYLADVFGGFDASESARKFLQKTIGFSGVAHDAPTGLGGLLPHVFTCGRALIPAGLASFLAGNNSCASAESIAPHMQLVSATPSPLVKDVPCTLSFQLIHANTGEPLDDSHLEVVHTKKLHTMIVDHSLTDYQHLHPTYDPETKRFTCRFTPRSSQPYSAWHDYTLASATQPTHQRIALPAARGVAIPPRIIPVQEATANGITIHLSTDTPMRAGAAAMLRIETQDAAGTPLRDLEPIMGTQAHLVGFSQDGAHFLHCHPVGNAADGSLTFHIAPEAAGLTQFFLQIQRHGQQTIIPFGQRILTPEQFTTRAVASQGMHAGMAMA